MSNLSLAQLQELADQAGFPDPALAAAVAMGESHGNPVALNDNPPREHSIGLWQINTLAHRQFDPGSLTDPTYNATAAFQVYVAAGRSWQPWGSYTDGSYRQFYTGPSSPSGPASPWKAVGIAALFVGGGVAIWYLADVIAEHPRTRRLLTGEMRG